MEFEKHLKELEEMNEQLSSGKKSLKESIEIFKKGMKLIDKCRKELSSAEKSVQKLIKIDEETGELETEDFQPSEEE